MPSSRRVHAAAVVLAPVLVAMTPVPFDGTDLVIPKRAVQGTVDALAGANEYLIAPQAAFGTLAATFQVQTYRSADGTDEEVQLLITIPDGTFSNDDLVRIYFDVDHNHTNSAPDREVEVKRNNTGSVGGMVINSAPSSPVALPVGIGSKVWVQSNPGSWVAEVKLDDADLGLTGIPSIMGVYVQVWDSFNPAARFPDVLATTVASWANLKTRYPIDFMIILDQSGSMLSQSKWDNAKRAADFFANTMAILGEPAYFADRLGVVTFAWPCTGADATTTPKPLAALGAFPVGAYTSAIASPIGNNCTPIGRGLNVAFGAGNLNATLPDDNVGVLRDRGALLLSDGLQNRPGSTIVPADAGYDPCPAVAAFNACPPGTASNVPVSTVALGDDWGVDTDLLQKIQGRYLGPFHTSYNLTTATDVEALKEDFIGGLEDLFTTNFIYTGVVPASFPVLSGEDKLIAIASWTTAAQAENIALQRDPGGGFATVPCSVPAASSTTVGFAVCAIDNPAGGTWRVVAADGAFNNPVSRLFVVADLRLRARFQVDPVQPGTGEDLLLTVELRDRGQPVLHAPPARPVSVRVHLETPEEGVGTFASTHDPQCKQVQPALPPIDRGDPQMSVTGAAGQLAAPSAFMLASTASTTATGDPDPALFSLVSQLLEACSRAGLARGADPGLELRDDGTQGDVTAGDGVYSLRYPAVDVAGSYVFRYEVDGTSADGERFTRTRRMARYVRVQPTAAASGAGSRVLQQSGNLVVREFYLLPRDRFGGYLGPGKAHDVDFVRTAGPGTFVGPVIDYGNGYYARRLQYDRSQGEPVVVPTVYGEPLSRPLSRPLRGPFELGVFAGGTFFDDDLGLDDGLVFGARLGYRLAGPLVLELEGAVTHTGTTPGSSGQAIQLFGNLRYDLAPHGTLAPFVRAGAGQVLFRDFGTDDEAAAFHAGGGLTWWLTAKVGLRAEARAIYIQDVFAAGATTSYQATGGLVIRF